MQIEVNAFEIPCWVKVDDEPVDIVQAKRDKITAWFGSEETGCSSSWLGPARPGIIASTWPADTKVDATLDVDLAVQIRMEALFALSVKRPTSFASITAA